MALIYVKQLNKAKPEMVLKLLADFLNLNQSFTLCKKSQLLVYRSYEEQKKQPQAAGNKDVIDFWSNSQAN